MCHFICRESIPIWQHLVALTQQDLIQYTCWEATFINLWPIILSTFGFPNWIYFLMILDPFWLIILTYLWLLRWTSWKITLIAFSFVTSMSWEMTFITMWFFSMIRWEIIISVWFVTITYESFLSPGKRLPRSTAEWLLDLSSPCSVWESEFTMEWRLIRLLVIMIQMWTKICWHVIWIDCQRVTLNK